MTRLAPDVSNRQPVLAACGFAISDLRPVRRLAEHGRIVFVARPPVKRRVERPAPAAQIWPDGHLEGRRRVVIEGVSPEINEGRFPAKRAVGEKVTVEADIFADGHDALAAVLRYRHESASDWIEVPMAPLVNDRWRGEFAVTALGRYLFTLEGWVDHFETWRRQFFKRVEARQDVAVELEVAARMG